jgi:hypothetical protein
MRAGQATAGRTWHQLTVTLARWRRWEFWPMWLFYAPVVPWIAWLSLRYRGLTTITASNPGIVDGGVVGESKFDILSRLPQDAIVPTVVITPGRLDDRLESLRDHIRRASWDYPLVAKPDVGQRGVGVRLIRSFDQAVAYLSGEHGSVLFQPYHPGPFEAGIFYYRFPGSMRGRILSITDKCFPSIEGNGRSTVEALIEAHPRYRLQSSLFLQRLDAVRRHVPRAGERIVLAIAGNHAQGTMFLDGQRLWTPALEARVDEIARAFPGFFVGRFDVRYRDADGFMAGRDIAIVELNGATAESTNIYDPSRSLWAAYRQLYGQWSIVFAIGDRNRAAGAAVSSMRRLLRLVVEHARRRPVFALAD